MIYVCIFAKRLFGKMEKLQITTLDGQQLMAALKMPETTPKAVVQINMGTAARKEFYFSFVEFLAKNGYVACVFDYRGTGFNAEQLKNCNYEYIDYGLQDIPAVFDYLCERFPDLPKFIVGHSAGGQQIGYLPNLERVSGMVCCAVSVGYWGFMPWSYRIQTHFYFDILRPISLALFGYMKTKKLLGLENLPPRVVNTWRDWCSVPDWYFNERFYGKTVPIGRYKDIPFAIKIYSSTDDPISHEKSTKAFWRHVSSTKSIDIEVISPSDVGAKEIGHFGFFRKQFKDTIWQKILDDLNKF
jgi:predicted alpha/beta hydrolase